MRKREKKIDVKQEKRKYIKETLIPQNKKIIIKKEDKE